MSWRTRNMRKRNKGKIRGTKRILQRGGASVETLNNVISHLVETGEEVSAKIDKMQIIIKFVSPTKFKCISGLNGDFSFTVKSGIAGFGGNIMIDNTLESSDAKINGKKMVLDKLSEFEKIVSLNKTNNEIKNKADSQIKENEENVLRERALAENKVAVETQQIKDTYRITHIDLEKFMKKVPVDGQIQPYTESALKHLSHCVEKYLMNAISINEIRKFLEMFNTTESSVSEEPKITLDIVKKKIQFAIDVVSSIKVLGIITNRSEKNELVEILTKLNTKIVEPSNKYSFDKECSLTDVLGKTMDYDICFFIKCIKFYGLKDEMLDSTTSISDVVTNGTVSGYDKLAFVSDEKNVESYIGCVCYKEESRDSNTYINISKILENAKTKSEHKSEINKLIEYLKPFIAEKQKNLSFYKSMHIPSSLNEYVNKEAYESNNTDGEFTTWEMILTPDNIQNKKSFDEAKTKTSERLKDILIKLSTLFAKEISNEVTNDTNEGATKEETGIIKEKEEEKELEQENVPISKENPEQTGGKVDIDLQKHAELKDIDEIIKSLPASVYKENESLINETIDKINASSTSPDISNIATDIDKLKRDSSAIKGALKMDVIKRLLPDEVKQEEEFQTNNNEVQADAIPNETGLDETNANVPTADETVANANDETTTNDTTDTNVPSTNDETTTIATPTTDTPIATTTTTDTPIARTTTTDTTAPTTTDTPIATTTSETTIDAPTTTPSGEEPIVADATNPIVKEDSPLTLDDLKVSPSMINKTTNESGKYIFVPEKMVQLVVDYLLSNGCEITTTVMKK